MKREIRWKGQTKFRIAILGIGGVGGYFGGKLATHFVHSKDVEIIFIARGENEKAIKANGLKLITSAGKQIAKPKLVTNDAAEIGEVDFLILCVKTFDLEESIFSFRDCIGNQTVILPLPNGVDNADQILKIVPNREVWNGCAFIAARLTAPGIVKVDSKIKLLQFGSSQITKEKSELIEQIFKSAKINAEFSDDIDKTIWGKFIFISSFATLTSYLDANAGGINCSSANQAILNELINEVTCLAKAKNIKVDEDIHTITFNRIKGLSDEITSSMHDDFLKGGKTELETLTGYVVRKARQLNLSVPTYERLYGELQERLWEGSGAENSLCVSRSLTK